MDVSLHPCIPVGRAGSCGGSKQVTGREEGRRHPCVCVCVCVCVHACVLQSTQAAVELRQLNRN